MPLQLAISNVPSPRCVHRNTHFSFVPGRGSQQGRMNATSLNAEYRPRLAMNIVSKYPTPGCRIRSPTTWSAKSASAEGVSIPVEISSESEPTCSLGLSARKVKRHLRSLGARRGRPRYRDLDVPVLADTTELLAANAPCAMVPLKPNELSRDVR